MMTEQADFIDSFAPLEFDPERAEEWKLPPVKAWEPKPLSWLQRINVWLGGEA